MNPDRHPEHGQAVAAFYPEEGQLRDALKNAMPAHLQTLSDHLSLSAEQAKTLGEDHIKMLTGVIGASDVGVVHGLITRYLSRPASEEEVQKWLPEANKLVRETYGADADQLRKDAKMLVSKRPGLARVLTETGLGNHPKVIKAVVDMARRRRGRQPL